MYNLYAKIGTFLDANNNYIHHITENKERKTIYEGLHNSTHNTLLHNTKVYIFLESTEKYLIGGNIF